MTEPGTEADEPVTGLPVTSARGLRRFAALCVGCLLSAAVLGLAIHGRLPGVDARLHAFALSHRGGWNLAFARAVTHLGSTRVIWPVVFVAALIFPRQTGSRRVLPTLAVAATGGAAVGAGLLLNHVLARPRPPVADWAAPAGGPSYPSGHTTAATIGAGLLAWAVCRHLQHRRGREAIWVVAVLWAASVGCSRAWLGVHWPLDVLGGWLFGTGWLSGVAAVLLWAGRSAAETIEEPAGRTVG